MKYLLITIMAFGMIACGSGTETDTSNDTGSQPTDSAAVNTTDDPKDSAEIDDPIALIKSEYSKAQEFCSANEGNAVEYPEGEDTHYGGLVTTWKDGEDLVKVIWEVYDDHGLYIVEFYFSNGELSFCHLYQDYVAMNENPPTDAKETRYYIVGQEVIKILKKAHIFPPGEFDYGTRADMSSVPNEELTDFDGAERFDFIKGKLDQALLMLTYAEASEE